MSLYQYGNEITYQSLPDYDTLVPFDTAWDCEDWRIYYEVLEEEYGKNQARRIWNDAWAENGLNADVLNCKYGEVWRDWADSNQLVYDPNIFQQTTTWIYDTGSSVGGAVSGLGNAVEFLGKNFKYIVAGALVFVGLYAYKNYIKGNEKIKFK